MSDESLTGDPMGYITASQLSDFILDLDANFATEETSVADVDKFFFHDVSADAMRYITKADLATELGGGGKASSLYVSGRTNSRH